ncbi:MAG: hypothetical protein IIC20_03400 [Chloroflexi bacterium]|nr:hypothetical protein [Chloroflexota bacterium]
MGDRWLYGYLAQPRPLKFYGPRWVARLALFLAPRPDLVVLLEAPADIAYSRKPELSRAEIEQEFEPPETPIVTLNEDEAIVEGQVPLDEVNETLSTALVGDGFETIGGFVLYHLGRMPKAGDNLEAAGVFVEVLSTAGRRINKLRVKKVAPKDRKVKAAQRSGS